jgi:hypothetical protein
MRNSAFKLSSFAIALLIAGAPFAHGVRAAGPPTIGIDPARFEFRASPRAMLKASFAFSNDTASSMPIHAEGNDFTPVGEDGKIVVGESPDTGHSLKNWMTAEPIDVLVPAHSNVDINFAIRVPADATLAPTTSSLTRDLASFAELGIASSWRSCVG